MGRFKLIEREYIVTLKKDVDYQKFNEEMIQSTGAGAIPNRTVDVADARPGSKRNTHYALTEAEVIQLRKDSRVDAVEIPPEQRTDISPEPLAIQTGNFSKTTSDSGNYMNWGMRRCIERDNPYTFSSPSSDEFAYTLDGTGVDVVIQDTGIQVGHPEFNDADGNSRIKQIDWYAEAGVSGSMPSSFYSDYNGHGTHVAGTVAGINYGWAKNAHIHAMKIPLGSGGSGIQITQSFDLIKLWHRNKPITSTGYRRPTIVNMSWGYGRSFSSITGGNYRGTNWTGTSKRTDYGMVGSSFYSRHPVRLSVYDADVDEMSDEGIHVCIAAGNSRQKIDNVGGVDYDNYYNTSNFSGGSSRIYYHRGGSPFGNDAMIIGNLDSNEHSGGLEQKASSSETGPGITVYAPGTNIMSAWRSTGGMPYHLNSSHRQNNITGTSMASPQVCGLGACILQLEPYHTAESLKQKIRNLASQDKIFSTGQDDDYTNTRSILDSANKLLYTPFNSGFPFKTT